MIYQQQMISLDNWHRWCKDNLPYIGGKLDNAFMGVSVGTILYLIIALVLGRLIGEITFMWAGGALLPKKRKKDPVWKKCLQYGRHMAFWGPPAFLVHVHRGCIIRDDYHCLWWVFMLPFGVYAFLWTNVLIDLLFMIVLPRVPKVYHEMGFLHIVKSIVRVVVLMYAFLMLLRIFVSFDLDAWLQKLSTGAGILTGIAALASKDFMSNFFGSLLVIVSRPFKIGDWIVINKLSGRVKKITMRTTQLEAVSGVTIEVPNSFFVGKDIQNHGQGSYFAWPLRISFAGSSIVHAEGFMEKIASTLFHDEKLELKRCNVEFKEISDSCAMVTLHLSFKAMEEHAKLRFMHTLQEKLQKLAKTEQVEVEK